MTAHIAAEDLVEHLDGTANAARDAAITAHLVACADCRRRLRELADLDRFVASNHPGADATLTAMNAKARALIAAHAAPPKRRGWLHVAAAACLLIGLTALLFARPARTFDCGITVYQPAELVRAGELQRWHVDLDGVDDRWLCVLARGPDGAVPLRGRVRVPASELSDWEFAAGEAPSEVLIAPLAAAPDVARIDALGQAFGRSAGAERQAKLAALAPGARIVAFPPR
jgi:hypothetical protein